MDLQIAYFSSPIGIIEITGDENGIATVYFVEEQKKQTAAVHPSLKECIYQLEEYFNGIRRDFGLRLNPQGSEFQQKVWKQLQKVPFGKTVSYLDISRELGDVNATRAVGNANGSNPLSIIVPCHRVVGSSGKLTGYSGGLWRKEWLLKHEQGIVFGKQISLF